MELPLLTCSHHEECWRQVNKLKPQLSLCALFTVKKKLEDTMQVVLRQAPILKDPLHIKLPLVLPTTTQIQELAPQFLHVARMLDTSETVQYSWESAMYHRSHQKTVHSKDDIAAGRGTTCLKFLGHKSPEDLTTYSNTCFFPFQEVNPTLFSCSQWPA